MKYAQRGVLCKQWTDLLVAAGVEKECAESVVRAMSSKLMQGLGGVWKAFTHEVYKNNIHHGNEEMCQKQKKREAMWAELEGVQVNGEVQRRMQRPT